jgi:hypothetical protein
VTKKNPPDKTTAGPTIAAALIVGIALICGSYLLARSLDRTTEELKRIGTGIADVKEAVKTAAPRAPTQQARRGPDPERRYSMKTEGAPVIGAKHAKVTLIEVSDFQ